MIETKRHSHPWQESEVVTKRGRMYLLTFSGEKVRTITNKKKGKRERETNREKERER